MSPELVTLASPANDSTVAPLATPPEYTSMLPLLSIEPSPSDDTTMPYAP